MSTKLIYSRAANGPNYSSRVKNRGGPAKIYTVNFHSLLDRAPGTNYMATTFKWAQGSAVLLLQACQVSHPSLFMATVSKT